MKRVFSATENGQDRVFSSPQEDAPEPQRPAPIPPRSGVIGALTEKHRETIARIMARKPPAEPAKPDGKPDEKPGE